MCPLPAIIAAIAPHFAAAAGTVASTWAGNKSSKLAAQVSRENTDKTVAAQREMSDLAYQRDVEMWNQANAYNAPAAQMQRLSDAGLNPNMIYGATGAVGNTSTQTPSYKPPSPEYNYQARQYVAPNLLNFQDIRLRDAQITATERQSENIQANTSRADAETANILIRSAQGEYDLDLARELRENVMRQAQLTTMDKELSVRMKSVESELQREFAARERQLGLDLQSTQVQSTIQGISESIARIQMINQNMTESNARIANIQIDNQLKTVELGLRRLGINPNESGIVGLLQRWLIPDVANDKGFVKGVVGGVTKKLNDIGFSIGHWLFPNPTGK